MARRARRPSDIPAMVPLYGLVADPATVERQLRSVGGILPDEARQIAFDQMSSIVSAPRGGLSVGLAIAVAVALRSASAAMQNLITALNATDGSLGAVVVRLCWFWPTADAVLLGAELNADIEHQTARDTTTGPRTPLGGRSAVVADTIGAPVERA